MRELMDITKALADENRTRVLMFLRRGELCLCQIIEMLGLAPSTVSKHMAILHSARLIESRKEGRWIFYRLADGEAPACVLEAIQWVRKHLEGDRQIREDVRRLNAVCRMSREKLCACYKG